MTYSSNRTSAVVLFLSAVFLLIMLLPGCGDNEPSTDHLALALEEAFARKQPVELDDVAPKWVKTGEARLEGKTTLTLRLKEDIFLPAELGDELAALKLKSAETALLRHALDQVKTQSEPLRSSLLEKAPPLLEKQLFIKLSGEEGDSFPAEASIRAQKGVDGWELAILDIAQPCDLAGLPRSALSAEALVVSSPEAKKLVNEHIKAVREYAALVDKAVTAAADSLAKANAQKRAAILAAFSPGAVFMGTLEKTDKSITESGLVVEEAGADLIKGFVFGNDPRQKNAFIATIRDGEKPILLNISTNQPDALAVAELDIKDGRLVGSGQGAAHKDTWAAVSWAPSDQAALDAKTAALVAQESARRTEEERLAAEQQKRLDDYQAALSAAIAPGLAYQGVWSKNGQYVEIGLYIETVAANGLSCEGYLFDPADRSKRKPFTGTVNREFEAGNALNLTAVRGQGLPHSYSTQFTATQLWLVDREHYSFQLALKDGALIGQTRDKATLKFTPLPDFSALLAQDQEAIKKRSEATQAAVQPDTEYAGIWQSKTNAGELGLKIQTLGDSGLVFTAELFDPANPTMTWSYNGSVLKKNDGEAMFNLVPLGKQLKTESSGQPGTTHYLLNYYKASYHPISLALTDEGLSGILDKNIAIVLKKISAAPPTAQTAYPPLTIGNNGKPKIAAHLVKIEGDAVHLGLQLLAPGKKLDAVRIDNLGGIKAHWRSDGQEGASPISVNVDSQSAVPEARKLDITAGEEEILLNLSLQDNGAFAGGATEFRVTVFFADGERAMCFLSSRNDRNLQ